MKPRITDTSKQDPAEHLSDALDLGMSQAIEASEAHGQAERINSTQLPTQNHDRQTMEDWGIVFGPPCTDDPLFCDAQLPEGWTKQSTDHAMWSNLVDDKGRERAMIFYKAAFYDRDAFMRASRRFTIHTDYDVEDSVKFDVFADGNLLHSEVRGFRGNKYEEEWRSAESTAKAACVAWLETTFPDYDDPVKSWEIELKDAPEDNHA